MNRCRFTCLIRVAAFALLLALGGCADLRAAAAQRAADQQAWNAAAQQAQAAAAAMDEPPSPECRSAEAPAEVRSKPGYTEFALTAADSAGRPLTGLKQSEFQAKFGEKSCRVVYLHEIPTSIALLVDTSGSMRPKLDTVSGALASFLKNLNACDEVFLAALFSATLPASSDG